MSLELSVYVVAESHMGKRLWNAKNHISTSVFILPGADYYMDGTLHTKVLPGIQQSHLYQQELKEPLLQRSILMQHTGPGYK